MSEQVEGLLLVFKRLIGKVKPAPPVTSAALQLDVLADMNIFLEKCPFLTTLPFMQETQKWQDSTDRHSHITVSCTLSSDLTSKPPGNPKVYHVSYIILPTSENPLLPVGGNASLLASGFLF